MPVSTIVESVDHEVRALEVDPGVAGLFDAHVLDQPAVVRRIVGVDPGERRVGDRQVAQRDPLRSATSCGREDALASRRRDVQVLEGQVGDGLQIDAGGHRRPFVAVGVEDDRRIDRPRHPGIRRERLREDGAALEVHAITGKQRRRVDLRQRLPGFFRRRTRIAVAPARADVEVPSDHAEADAGALGFANTG